MTARVVLVWLLTALWFPLSFLLAIGCGPEPVPRKGFGDAGVEVSTEPPPMKVEELGGKVRVLAVRSDVAIDGVELAVAPGDMAIENDEAIAVITAADGRAVAFAPKGGKNGLEGFGPAVFDAFDEAPGDVERIEPALDGRAVHVVKRLRSLPLRIDAWFGLQRSVLLLRWRLSAENPVMAVTPGEVVFWGNTPTWVEGHGFVEAGGSLSSAFLARESHGSSYAFCREDGRVTARFRAPDAPGYHRSARTGEHRITLAAGGTTLVRSVALSLAKGSLGDAVAALPCRQAVRAFSVPVDVVARAKGGELEVAHCELEHEFRARLDRQKAQPEQRKPELDERGAGPPYLRYRIESAALAAPEGCARVRIVARGQAPGAWIDPSRDDERGWRHPKLLPRGGEIAWRVRDREGAVLPATLVVRGTPDPDWGDDGRGGAAKNVVYADRDGSMPAPPGQYRVVVHRGFEYTLHEASVVVREGATATVTATLERTVDTSGWISADLHVHALPSFDAPTLLEDRVRSLAGVGVEVAVATDHNAVTDYRPAIAALDLEAHVASIVGDEVTTEEPLTGHFNVFPLAPGSAPIGYRRAHPRELFAAARRAAPEGVLQVNHPRMGDIGYFELFRLDRGAVEPWAKEAPLVAMDFDAVEVFNGDHIARIGEVEQVLKDWYALLDAGMRYTATGNSDSHKIAYQEAGSPRNLVALDPDDPARFDAPAFVRAVRQGRVVVSNGPFIDLRVGTARPGDDVAAGDIAVRVVVDAPPWMDVSEVELRRRSGVVRRWKIAGKPRPRLKAEATIAVQAGDWLVCIARGRQPMTSLYPSGVTPFAFTNPIWVTTAR